jgi:isopenicillin N synthase-like dioxygenase
VQGTVDFNEVWDCCPPDAFDESKYPIEVPGFKEAFDAIRPILSALGQKILVSLGLMLNLDDPDFFLKAHPQLENPLVQGNIDGFRSYYCMPVDSAATVESELETHRLSAHCHFGTIMFSFQNSSEGFEVQNRETNEWVSVSPIKGTILVCPGLALENWSGGQILAVKHRVRADKETDHLAKIKGTAYVLPGSEVTCMPVVDEAPGWKPHYPKHKPGQTHDEYFRDRIRGSRRPQHQKK